MPGLWVRLSLPGLWVRLSLPGLHAHLAVPACWHMSLQQRGSVKALVTFVNLTSMLHAVHSERCIASTSVPSCSSHDMKHWISSQHMCAVNACNSAATELNDDVPCAGCWLQLELHTRPWLPQSCQALCWRERHRLAEPQRVLSTSHTLYAIQAKPCPACSRRLSLERRDAPALKRKNTNTLLVWCSQS